MYAIACIDKNYGIGKNGNLLISIPDDMRFFRETTKDSVVIMGRKTLFSFKNKEPLKNRINVVFTHNLELKNNYKNFDNIYFISNKSELNDILLKYSDKKAFIIGGEKIYNDFIDLCDTVYITRIDKEFDADSYFPNLSEHGFKITFSSETKTYENINYKFITYQKI